MPKYDLKDTNDIRDCVCTIISEMLDNPDKNEIYPTTRCYDRLEQYIQTKIDQEVKKDREKPMGVSDWKEHGIKYGYYEYFKKEEVKKVLEEIKEEVLSAKYGTKNRVKLLCKLNSYIK